LFDAAGRNSDTLVALPFVALFVTETYEDLVVAGVIDPLKVTRSALENASSIAQMILTTETLVADSPKKDED